jgi:nicotinamidase-related amidase
MKRLVVLALLTFAAMAPVPCAQAGDIVEDWAKAKAPPPPELKPVTVDPKTTALLILDMVAVNCNARPRCVASVAPLKKLHDAARAAGVMVFYTIVGPGTPTAVGIVDKAMMPRQGEWVVQRGPDKYLGSDLEARLKKGGIKTVIVTGTSAQGAVVGTSSGSAQRGYQVIVPVDTMSAEDEYNEQYAAYHLYKGGPTIITQRITLTRSGMIKF